MRIEHIGYMVEKPDELVRWYVKNLGFTVKRKIGGESGTHFLADSTGQVIIEIYNNPAVDLPDYRSMNPLVLHLSFAVDDIDTERSRLIDAGATLVDEETTSRGDRIVMLRDPWGFPIQLVRRKEPML